MNMPPRKKEPHTRMPVLGTAEQIQIVTDAAAAAGTDRSSWVLAHALKAARPTRGAEDELVLQGDLLKRIRREAERQGIKPEELIKQIAIAF